MKTVRQVKTVFIIFIAFVCCWSPYIVVLLYDSSDSLPLPVHMYTSMLAHLHASLNFAIYGLNSRSFRAGYRRFAGRVVTSCRLTTWNNTDTVVAAAAARPGCGDVNNAHHTSGSKEAGCHVNRSLVAVAVECQQLQNDGADTSDASQPLFSVSTEEEHECHTVITQCKWLSVKSGLIVDRSIWGSVGREFTASRLSNFPKLKNC